MKKRQPRHVPKAPDNQLTVVRMDAPPNFDPTNMEQVVALLNASLEAVNHSRSRPPRRSITSTAQSRPR